MRELSQESNGKKPRRRLLILLAIGLGLVVLFIMFLAGVVMREGLRASHVKLDAPGRQHLEKVRAASQRPRAGRAGSALPVTTQTLPNPTQMPSGAVELLKDTPDLHPVFRAQRDAINRRFANLLRRVEEYERTQAQLSPEMAERQLTGIGEIIFKDGSTINELDHTLKTVKERGAQEHLLEPVREAYYHLYNWFDAQRIQVSARQGKYGQAAFLAEHYMANRLADWKGSRPPGQPAYLSDYFRGAGREDYQRVISYYWKQGGVNGYGKILDVALPHYYQMLVDSWKRSESETKKTEHTQ